MNDAHPDPAPRAGLLWLAFAAFAVYGLPGNALGVAWLELRGDFGRDLEALGQLLAALTLGNLLTSAPIGRLIERFGLGPTTLSGSLLIFAGLVGFSLSSSWGALLGSTLVMGLGMGALNPAVNAFVAHHHPVSRMSWLHVAYGLGSLLGPLLITLLVLQSGFSWRLAFALFATLQFGVSAFIARTLPAWRLEPTAEDPDHTPLASTPSDRAASLRLPLMWLVVTLYIVHNGLALSAGQLSGVLLVEARGLSATSAGVWVSLFFVAILVGRVLLGLSGERVAGATLLRLSTQLAILGAALLWWHPAPGSGVAGLLLLGLALATIYPLGIARTPALVGRRHSASAIGFQIAGGALGAATTPWLIGRLSTTLGPEVIAAALFALALGQLLVHEVILHAEARVKRVRASA